MQDRRLGLHAFAEGIAEDFRRALMQRFDSDLARSILKEHSLPFRELMAYYRCALMEVETKFRVLNEDLSLDSEQNPIEGIESRHACSYRGGHERHCGHSRAVLVRV